MSSTVSTPGVVPPLWLTWTSRKFKGLPTPPKTPPSPVTIVMFWPITSVPVSEPDEPGSFAASRIRAFETSPTSEPVEKIWPTRRSLFSSESTMKPFVYSSIWPAPFSVEMTWLSSQPNMLARSDASTSLKTRNGIVVAESVEHDVAPWQR